TDNMKEKNQPESLASNLSVPTSLLTTTLRTDKTRAFRSGWIVTTWNRPVSSLAFAPAMPTTATGMCDTSSPPGCNKHVRSPKG
ncbi:hypothetical protein, partial [Arthrobacter nitrophenolicus]